jgi:small-conductance mechanosensitive channel
MAQILQHWQGVLWAVGILVLATTAALVAHRIVFAIFHRFAERTGSVVHHSLILHGRKPAKWILPLLTIVAVLPVVPVRRAVILPIQHVLGVALIAALAWGVIVVADVMADVAVSRYRIDVADNLAARRIRTQIQVMRRVFVVVVVVLTIGIMLLTIPAVQQVGTSLLASAGIVGLVVGMAMRPTLSSLVAGLQIALTEPIRLDDVVIVEGEWGRVEEISTTYVVVCIWDLRRLVVPLSYFIENPFQNWTRVTADLLGTVFLYVDYQVPVEQVRAELRRILESSPLWDRKVCGVQVTDATERTVQLRALMSAADSSKAWDLRCFVREKLITFLQERYPESLPRVRAEFDSRPEKFGTHIPANQHEASVSS